MGNKLGSKITGTRMANSANHVWSGSTTMSLGEQAQTSEEGLLSPQEKAFSIHLITEEILSTLDVSDMKNLRLVNKVWCVAASKKLSTNACSVIVFEVGFDTKENEKNNGLKRFNKLLTTRKRIFRNNFQPPAPYANFRIGGFLDSPHVHKLFNLQGDHVKILGLTFSRNQTKSEPIIKILEKTPGIEELYLASSTIQCTTDMSVTISLSFPLLRVFTSGHYPLTLSELTRKSLAYKILKGSPNLKQVNQVKISNIEFFLQIKKLNLVNELTMDSGKDNNNMTKIELLANPSARIKILSLKFNYDNSSSMDMLRFSPKLNRILDLTKETLEEIKTQPLGLIAGLELPKFETLKLLKMYANKFDANFNPLVNLLPWKFFPTGLNIAETFPCLSAVTMQWMGYNSQESYFPSTENLKFVTVRILDLYVQNRSPLCTAALEKFFKIFPELKTLRLFGYVNLDNLTDVFRIWDGPQLDSFEFHKCENVVDPAGSHVLPKRFTPEDSTAALTGISKKDYGRILRSQVHFKKVKTAPVPSIINLIGLRTFVILVPKGHQDFLKIARSYAQWLMPDVSFVVREYSKPIGDFWVYSN